MDWTDVGKLVLFVSAGGIAGFVNTLAGGGSLLTIPALIFLGIPSTMANATNRVAVLLQSLLGNAVFDLILGPVLIVVLLTMFIRKPTGGGENPSWTRSPWVGVNFAVQRGAGAVRWVIVAAVALSSLRLFGIL